MTAKTTTVKMMTTATETTATTPHPTEPQHQLNYIDPPMSCSTPDLTQNAITVLERRYLKKDSTTGEVIETPAQLFWRVATHVAKAELAYAPGNYERAMAVATEFYDLMAQRNFMPNSPCLMNAGREMGMLSACFVLPVEDSIEGIFEAIKATALIQKAGGGTGFSFSRLRPRGDMVASSGGTTEGPMSFIQVFSKATDAIQQGAFRRGANMGMMRIDHPDIYTFITFKDDPTKLTNYNISVSVTDKFLDCLKSDPMAIHEVKNPRTGEWSQLCKENTGPGCETETPEYWKVGELWDLIIKYAHKSGEPGVIFIDRINKSNPIKNVGEIEATNPCGEQPLHAWDSCNLGSINLGKLIQGEGEGETATFDWASYKTMIHSTTRFLDNVIEVNRYPLPQIDNMSKTTRRIGLGVMGFADALYKMGIGYNTPEGTTFGEEVMKVLDEESHLASEMLAEERGCFPAWEGSDWETKGRKMRNSYTTTVAPTGTISIIANCSGGIEPMFSLAFNRQVMKDTEGKPTIMREVNYVFEAMAKEAGCYSEEMIDGIIEEGSIQHMDEMTQEMKDVFVTAHDITPYWHMKMQAAFQNHCDASISKTINFPHDATAADVREIYEMAIEEGVKGVTVYRDGCREMQPMALKGSGKDATNGTAAETTMASDFGPTGKAQLEPAKLPEMMPSVRIRQSTPFGNMHVQISYDPKTGAPCEVFAQLGRAGDVANSDLEGICRMVSLWLRANGSLEMAVDQLSGIGSSLSVPTADGRIMSLPDGLACAMRKYLDSMGTFDQNGMTGFTGMMGAKGVTKPSTRKTGPTSAPRNVGNYKIKCPTCSDRLAFEEGCVKCYGCGFSQC
jgi:ribonucleoside-diphosphate reductase alpha chain